MEQPLAEQLRPKSFAEIVGQDHLVGKNGFITSIIKKSKPISILLWGPPGSGKTSIARLYANAFPYRSEFISPIFNGIADLKKLFSSDPDTNIEPIILFVDEIHRFNKAQQDAFLPLLENGKLILIGATVENPSFYLNGALLSRLRVLKLNFLTEDDLEKLLQRFENIKGVLNLTPPARKMLIHLAQGDGRYLFNLVENIQGLKKKSPLEIEDLENFWQSRAPLFDKGTDQHYNLISALHKSVRGSDPDASLYWFSRMLNGGEDPLYIARRLIRMASEDIGLADPHALTLAISARDAYEMLGSPEGELALAEVVVYLALAPKSNAVYTAFNEFQNLASETSQMDPPYIILNAPTKLMKKMGYGKGYIYDHAVPEAFSGQNYFPDDLERKEFYNPTNRGFEAELSRRLKDLKQKRNEIAKGDK